MWFAFYVLIGPLTSTAAACNGCDRPQRRNHNSHTHRSYAESGLTDIPTSMSVHIPGPSSPTIISPSTLTPYALPLISTSIVVNSLITGESGLSTTISTDDLSSSTSTGHVTDFTSTSAWYHASIATIVTTNIVFSAYNSSTSTSVPYSSLMEDATDSLSTTSTSRPSDSSTLSPAYIDPSTNTSTAYNTALSDSLGVSSASSLSASDATTIRSAAYTISTTSTHVLYNFIMQDTVYTDASAGTFTTSKSSASQYAAYIDPTTTVSTTLTPISGQLSDFVSSTTGVVLQYNDVSSAITTSHVETTTSKPYPYANATSDTGTVSTSTAFSATGTVRSTVLVIARDFGSASEATSGLNAYGIPYEVLAIPQAGASLPVLENTAGGNYGGIIIVSGVAYYYDATAGWHSAITTDQWTTLYAYQVAYRVRMVQWDIYPQPAFGTTPVGSCCDGEVDQIVSFTNTAAFAQAGLRPWAGMSTQGLSHYLARVTDTSTTTEIAQFAANGEYSANTTAAVINNFGGREQMVFFITWAPEWSATSNYLQHAYIAWMTRGLYAGFRRVHLNTQVDDVLLATDIYHAGDNAVPYRITVSDMETIKAWIPTVSAKMNLGSWYMPELGHNGNGNVLHIDPDTAYNECSGGPIYTDYDTTNLEFPKPLGTGIDGWPDTPNSYPFSDSCLTHDPLAMWFRQPSNRDAFLHVSHTFTHEGQNNATYADVGKEISWNQIWFNQTGISDGNFTSNGLIPPAITGLHNGDALRAWWDNGITNCVGDNSRPLLVNQQNTMWPYITTHADNGFDGMLVIPRWPLRIYYDCDTPVCTFQEWVDTSHGTGDFTTLMAAEKTDTMRHFFGLRHDGVMFHQINLRSTDMSDITNADGSTVRSLLQAWVEQTVQEFGRLVDWPLTTMKQSDLAVSFADRMTRDGCGYSMNWTLKNTTITSVTLASTSGSCAVPVPLTLPVSVVDTKGFATEKLGNDPLTVWVQLTGRPVTLTLTTPILT